MTPVLDKASATAACCVVAIDVKNRSFVIGDCSAIRSCRSELAPATGVSKGVGVN